MDKLFFGHQNSSIVEFGTVDSKAVWGIRRKGGIESAIADWTTKCCLLVDCETNLLGFSQADGF
jgi:hypothetical protein